MDLEYEWTPDEATILASNIYKMMELHNYELYEELYRWSVDDPNRFWRDTMDLLEIRFNRRYDMVLDMGDDNAHPTWLKGAEFNIVESCFRHADSATAIIYMEDGGELVKTSHQDLQSLINRIANSLKDRGFGKGDNIALAAPMNIEAVAIYMAIIKAGMVAVIIDENLSASEIKARLDITSPKICFVQDQFKKGGQVISLYQRMLEAGATQCIVMPEQKITDDIRSVDIAWKDFLADSIFFMSVPCKPDDLITILFSTAADGELKAIPWNHATPIKSAADGFYHQNIQNSNVVCWPGSLGHVMGPWLVFASMINEAAMALYGGEPTGKGFGRFVKKAKVNVLGLNSGLVEKWEESKCMEEVKWSEIKCFSISGALSDRKVIQYLMNLAGEKPVIEYGVAAQLGGGYVSGSVIKPGLPGTFSMPVLGTNFVLLDDNDKATKDGKVHLIMPNIGHSNVMINNNHSTANLRRVNFESGLELNSRIMMQHDDHLEQLPNGYYRPKAQLQ